MRIQALFFVLAVVISGACGGSKPTTGADAEGPPQVLPSSHVKAIWITRFDYSTRADIEAALDNVTEAGFNTVLWQVRGNATAFYDSPFEPWAEQLGGVDPGFDPLAVAVEGARARGLSLHAWVNLMPAWWGDTAPSDPAQLYNARPDWMWFDQFGARQPLSDKFYVSVNPCLPDVREYLTDVVVDIARRYEVEGIHLDYARFPKEPPGTPKPGLDYPRDARTLALFQAFTTLDVTDEALTDPGIQAAWDLWRTQCVTKTIESIATDLAKLPHPPLLTAAVKAEPDGGLAFHQDARTWTRQGLVGAVFPMNYTADLDLFVKRNAAWKAELDQQRAFNEADTPGVANPAGFTQTALFICGINAADEDPAPIVARIRRALLQADGFALFGYAYLFDSVNESTTEQTDAEAQKRARRRAGLVPFLREL